MQLANSEFIIKDHTEWFPNTSFGDRGPSLDWVAEAGYYIISAWKPYDRKTEKLVPAVPHLFEGMCCIVDVEPLTAEELQAKVDTEWNAIRSQRNQRLKDTDWTQVADAPVDKAAWATYRQALRDITTQDDPFNVTWPVEG